MKVSLSPGRMSEHASYGSIDDAGDLWSNKSTPRPTNSVGSSSGRETKTAAAFMQVEEKQVVAAEVLPQKSFQAVSFHGVSYSVRPFICSSKRKEILHAVR